MTTSFSDVKIDQLFNGASASANFTSIPYRIGGLRDYSIHVIFSSTSLTGTLSLESSISGLTTEFVPVEGSSEAVANGEQHIWNVFEDQTVFVRVVWVRSSGTGTFRGTIGLKPLYVRQM